MRFLLLLLALVHVHAWCDLRFDSQLTRRTLGLVCESLGCDHCPDGCVSVLDWTTLRVRSRWTSTVADRLALEDIVAQDINCTLSDQTLLSPSSTLPIGDGTPLPRSTLFPFIDHGTTLETRVQQWRQLVSDACQIDIVVDSATVILDNCTQGDAAILSTTGTITARPRMRLHNAWSAAAQRDPTVLRRDGGRMPAVPPELDGSGQVIGTVDSGVDVNNCYFRDGTVSPIAYIGCGANAIPAQSQLVAYPTMRKVIQYVYDNTGTGACGDKVDYVPLSEGHGTHTAGTLAGAARCPGGSTCNADMQRFSGVAPGAKLAVFDAGPDSSGGLILPVDLGNAFIWGYLAGARVHSDSWGADNNGVYGGQDYETDRFAYAHEEMLIVMAAGNAGESATDPYVMAPGMAKNVLTVGSVLSPHGAREAVFCGPDSYYNNQTMCAANEALAPGLLSTFSSRGMQSGAGRVKPDVVASGEWIWSSLVTGGCADTSSDSTPIARAQLTGMAGTSMATPVVAGAATLLRQYFVDGFHPCGAPATQRLAWSHVPASLLRAGMVLAADGATSAASTGGKGYGQVGLPSMLAAMPFVFGYPLGFTGDGVAASPALSTAGASDSYAVCVTGGGDVRIVLAWTDPATTSDSRTTGLLVNDLDLLVSQSSNTWWRGNGHADITSNVEVVHVSSGSIPAGTPLTVRVTATRLAVSPTQRYSLIGYGVDACINGTQPLTPVLCSNATFAQIPVQHAAGPLVTPVDPDTHIVRVTTDGEQYATADGTPLQSVSYEAQLTVLNQSVQSVAIEQRTFAAAAAACGGPIPMTTDVVGMLLYVDAGGSAVRLATNAQPYVRPTMYWFGQRLLFCADGNASWVDVTESYDSGFTLQPESSAPMVLTAVVSGQTNGTFVVAGIHTDEWDFMCTRGLAGCDCTETAAAASSFASSRLAVVVPASVVLLVGTAWKSASGTLMGLGLLATVRYESQPAAAFTTVAIGMTLMASAWMVFVFSLPTTLADEGNVDEEDSDGRTAQMDVGGDENENDDVVLLPAARTYDQPRFSVDRGPWPVLTGCVALVVSVGALIEIGSPGGTSTITAYPVAAATLCVAPVLVIASELRIDVFVEVVAAVAACAAMAEQVWITAIALSFMARGSRVVRCVGVSAAAAVAFAWIPCTESFVY